MRQHHKAVIFMVCSLFLGKSQLLFGKIQISHTSDKPLIRALMFNKKAKKKRCSHKENRENNTSLSQTAWLLLCVLYHHCQEHRRYCHRISGMFVGKQIDTHMETIKLNQNSILIVLCRKGSQCCVYVCTHMRVFQLKRLVSERKPLGIGHHFQLCSVFVEG